MKLSNIAERTTNRVNEEPVLGDDLRVEKELGADLSLLEEVGCEERDPLENGEAGAGLEHEHGDGLLEDQSDNDSRPTNHISTCLVEGHVKQQRTKECACGVWRSPRRRTGTRTDRARISHGRHMWCSMALHVNIGR